MQSKFVESNKKDSPFLPRTTIARANSMCPVGAPISRPPPSGTERYVEWVAARQKCRGRCPHRPARWVYIRARLNGGMLICPVPFNIQDCSVRFRVDVGIDPYIPAGLHSIQPGAGVVRGGGRLVAAPTGYPEEFVHEAAAHAIVMFAPANGLTSVRKKWYTFII